MNPQMLNALMQALGGPQQFQQMYNRALQELTQNGMTPEQYVRSKLESGKMTPEQFQQARNFANKYTGMNR